ncbi:MAG: antibiotic biosynthesis monooxygenase [Verrucomicrobia bacterium]|nr:antibiotic biosynthesis monooxygenase [Verrucomicrobiota bacterium]
MHYRIWRYQVTPGRAEAFLAAYGSMGSWAQLFALASGYLGTRLLRPEQGDGSWMTIDCWESREHWETFLNAHRERYEALGRKLADLTTSNVLVGIYESAE